MFFNSNLFFLANKKINQRSLDFCKCKGATTAFDVDLKNPAIYHDYDT